jgi:LDH2 family malate/lactate/ureidoglycolate dehydrogenase
VTLVTNPRIPADALAAFVARVLSALGVPGADSARVAGAMVEADALGYDTHGTFRLRQYAERLKAGGFAAAATPRVLRETAATALVDGGNGLGHLAMFAAVELAAAKARQTGIGWVGVRGSNHAGPAALHVRPLADRGLIGLAAAVGSANHVPPWGGADILLGTNPLAVAFPYGAADHFVLDMATTVAAMGKIKTLAQRGEPMPEGWMIGRDGRPLTDPARRDEGFLLPIGGPKGYGLALAIGLLAGALNGAAFGSDVVDFTKDRTSPTNTGQFVAALDPAAFGDPRTIAEAAARALAEMRAAAPLPGAEAVRVPGDGKAALRARNLAEGIPLHPALRRELDALAGELGLAPLDSGAG